MDALEHSLTGLDQRRLQRLVVVVLDSCRDRSSSVARAWQERVVARSMFDVSIVHCDEMNVGRARALGCGIVLQQFHAHDFERVWLATTDADTRVPPHWLSTQVTQHDNGADAWAGRVSVTEWPQHRLAVAGLWQRAYDAEVRPIHGASFGVNASVYVDVGGFPPLQSSEDRGLYNALVAHGANIHYDSSAPVVTSARRNARAPDGFAAALTRFDEVDTSLAGFSSHFR